MIEKYYVVDVNGDKYGPEDIVQLTKWVREGRILPDNIISDAEGNKTLAKNILSFNDNIVPQKIFPIPNYNLLIITILVLGILAAIFVIAYFGLRSNYNALELQHIELKREYTTLEGNYKQLEKDNKHIKDSATKLIQDMVSKYNVIQSERDDLVGKLNQEISNQFNDTSDSSTTVDSLTKDINTDLNNNPNDTTKEGDSN